MSRHDLPSDSIEARAAMRVRRKLGFYTHATIFILVNLGLFLAHEFTGRPHKPFMLWGWGLGLAIHGLLTFASLQREGLRERMLRQEIERMKREQERDK